jgi:hypothetical protein
MNKKWGPDNELIKILIAAIGAVWYFLPVNIVAVAVFVSTLTVVLLNIKSQSLQLSPVIPANKIK